MTEIKCIYAQSAPKGKLIAGQVKAGNYGGRIIKSFFYWACSLVFIFLADLVVILHLCFVLFAVLGGFLVLWKSWMAWYHVPAVFWAAGIEFLGWICPLTPLENLLRLRGGEAGYGAGFVEHYIMPILYPAALTRKMQIGFGVLVLGVNIVIYLILWQKIQRAGRKQE